MNSIRIIIVELSGCERNAYPSEVNKMRKEAIKVGLETHVYNFCKMGVVNVRKYPEHLLIDRLTCVVEVWWESSLLAYPGAGLVAGPRSTNRRVRRRSTGEGSRRGVDCGGGWIGF